MILAIHCIVRQTNKYCKTAKRQIVRRTELKRKGISFYPSEYCLYPSLVKAALQSSLLVEITFMCVDAFSWGDKT